MAHDLFEINDPELNVDEIMGEVRERAKQRRAAVRLISPAPSSEIELSQDLKPLQENWDPEGALPSTTRIRWLKQLLFWMIRPFTRPQVTFNAGVMWALSREADRVIALATSLEALEAYVREGMRQQGLALESAESTARELAGARLELEQLRAQQHDTDSVLRRMTESAAKMEAAQALLAEAAQTTQEELAIQRRRFDQAMQHVGSGIVREGPASTYTPAPVASFFDHYFASLDRTYRGSREELREKMSVYIRLLANCRVELGEGEVLDIGCGRGTLLEMLREADVPARGVDLNENMVYLCQEKGLDVSCGDGLAHLASLPDGSLLGVVALHVAEHLQFIQLVELIRLAREKIQPGGLLILETPNPRNIAVGATEFYMDFSHRNPIHPLALVHLVREIGFRVVETEERNAPPSEVQFRLTSAETPDLVAENENWRRLNELFFGPRDYAVIARK